MLIILLRIIKQLLYGTMEGCKSLFLFKVREINAHICSRRHDIELWIKNINAMNNTVQPRKSERTMALILSNSILPKRMDKKKEVKTKEKAENLEKQL